MSYLNSNQYTRDQTYSPLEGFGDELSETKNLKKFVYDFAVQGGAVGALALLDDQGAPAVLPVGSVVQRTYLDVVTAVTSGGAATVSLDALATGDLMVATAKASLGVGLHEGKADGTMANALKITSGNRLLQRNNFSVAAQQVTATVAAAALTGGKFYVYCELVRSSLT